LVDAFICNKQKCKVVLGPLCVFIFVYRTVGVSGPWNVKTNLTEKKEKYLN